MSLFSRLLGGRGEDHYTEGLTLFEQGRFAEACDRFRRSVAKGSQDPTGSLAGFYLRQALTAEGRRLLVAGRTEQALPYLEEAATTWEAYPDLQFLYGAALGVAGRWEAAIACARTALRGNPQYFEACLLEAAGLVALDRRVEAAARLAHLVEAGSESDHWVAVQLRDHAPFTADNLPEDLEALLLRTAGGRAEKEDLAAAVTLCRAGAWEEGLVRLTDLVAKHPRYPDYRVKRAAALFQLGRIEEARAETDAALALNSRYQAARLLGSLLRAEQQRLEAAYRFLAEAPAPRSRSAEARHEELFGSYLRAVLALLTGRWEEIDAHLSGWRNLERTFAQAVVLRAAAADLSGRPDICRQHLESLADTWPAETDFVYLLAGHFLESGRDREVRRILGRWPVESNARVDARPLYLAGRLAVRSGRQPELMQPAPEDSRVPTAAWEALRAEATLLGGDAKGALEICSELWAADAGCEAVAVLQARILRSLGEAEFVAGVDVPEIWPDRVLVELVPAHYRGEQDSRVVPAVARARRVQPERPVWAWLTPEYWLSPIRGWIG